MKRFLGVFGIKYNKDVLWHNLVLCLALVLCLVVCLGAVRNAYGKNFTDPLPNNYMQFQQYALQFSAFLNGSIALEAEPTPRLEELDNPYDTAERKEAGLNYYSNETENSYLWDIAYYDGQYFSYFGIAPILTVYYPINLLTGVIPGTNLVCIILALLAIVFMGLAYRELVIRFAPNANLFLTAIGLIGVIWASGVYVGLSYSDNYYIAVLSAMEWSMASIFFGFWAMRVKKTLTRSILLAACAISLTLTVWSRPTVAVMCLILVPVFLKFALKTKKDNLHSQLIPIGSFFAVLAVGAGLVMWYNNVRFDSPFEFGSVYQLTVNDISTNKISFSLFIPAMGAYFLQPASYTENFPHIGTTSFKGFGIPAERYVYYAKTVGAFLFALPFGVFDSGVYVRSKGNITRTCSYFLIILLSVFTAFSDFCLGGVNMRYLFDFLPLISMFGAVAILDTQSETKGGAKAFPSVLLVLACTAAVFVTYGIIKCNAKDVLFEIVPTVIK